MDFDGLENKCINDLKKKIEKKEVYTFEYVFNEIIVSEL
jgi:hypothetical protein